MGHMTPAVVLERTRQTEVGKNLPRMMSKSKKFSRGYSSGFVRDYGHGQAVEAIGESEGFSSCGGGGNPDNSSASRRKCISLNGGRSEGMPVQTINLSKLTSSERKALVTKLRGELEQIQMLHKKFFEKTAPIVDAFAVSSSSDCHLKKAVQKTSNLKRSAMGRFEPVKKAALAPVPKPQGIHSNSMMMKQCERILKQLMSHTYGWVFNTPVDVVKLKIPDYYNVIKHPMDLGTIKTKLSRGAYSNPLEFGADVKLTFSNALTYNPPGNDVHVMAEAMSKFFEARWKPVEKKLAAPELSAKEEKVTVPAPTLPHAKRRKVSSENHGVLPQENIRPRMSNEEKQRLSKHLESLGETGDLPDHILDFLKVHGENMNQAGDEEIEIDIDSLSDATLLELRKLVDSHLKSKETIQKKAQASEIELINESGLSNSSLQPCKVNEPMEDEVDIGGNDPPISIYPPVEIDKDTVIRSSKCSTSSSFSSDSSSSSDSDSASSSGSESDVRVDSPDNVGMGNSNSKRNANQENNVVNPVDMNNSTNGANQAEQNAKQKSTASMGGHEDGESAPSERQISPDKLHRAALLKKRFADTILKAQEISFGRGDKGDPEKLRQEREDLEKYRREETARLQAEAKAAEEVQRRAEAEAEAEAKRKRELERAEARQALLKMEKTVDINGNNHFLRDLEMLRTIPADQMLSSIDETSPDRSSDGMGGFQIMGCNPLEQLGLYMKADDDEDDDGDQSIPLQDVEEGEIEHVP